MSVMMSPKYERGLVLGASEIRQLQEAMNDPSFPNIKPNFSFTESEVRLHGVGGRTVSQIKDLDLSIIEEFKPQVILLCVGGNDLSQPRPVGGPEVVAIALAELADLLHVNYDVQHIVIPELNPRYFPYCGRVYPTDYNQRVKTCNQVLYHMLEDKNYASFWLHKGILEWNPCKMFQEDGVHFSVPTGVRRWYCSFRGALIQALG